MKHFKRWTHLTVFAVVVVLGGEAQAQGSSGGYASNGGGYASSGGGYGSSGGYAAGYGSYGSSGGGGIMSHLKAKLHAHRASASVGGSSGGYVAYSASSGGAPHMGPLKRLAAKIHSHHAARHSGSSGGASSGGVAVYSGGSSGGYATSVASYSGGSSGGSSGGVASYSVPMMSMDSMSSPIYESPVIESSYDSYPSYDAAPVSDGTMMHGAMNDLDNEATYASAKPTLDDDAALLTVAVPSDDAEVTVNGHATTSEGSIRQFMSRGLKTGYLYTYVVNVKYTLNGKDVVDSKSVKLRPGDTEQLVFEPSEDAQPEATDQVSIQKVDVLETVVELRVPVNADVILAGNPTKGYGEVRTFRTKHLKAGESWKNYTVSVTAMVDGRSVTKQRSVDVHAGDQAKLDFDFEDGTVATR